jgi:hypothetical protein
MEAIIMKKSIITCTALTVLILFTCLCPAEEKAQSPQEKTIAGIWKLTVDFNGRQMNSTLTICTAEKEKPSVEWGLGGDEDQISNIKLDGNKLTFDRTRSFRDQEFTSTVTLNYDKQKDMLKGTISTDRGDNDVTGTRIIPKPDAVGTWVIKTEKGKSALTIKQKNDKLEGNWTSPAGKSEISNIKFKNGKLTFDRITKSEDRESKSSFTGEVKGNELKGEITDEEGTTEVTATRHGAEIIGKWALTTTSDRGERTSILLIDKDLTGRYAMGFGEMETSKIKLDGDKVTFYIDMQFGDRDFSMDYELKLAGDKLEGQVFTDRGDNKVTGKKIIPEPKKEKPKLAETEKEQKTTEKED